jgi:hypothetical protein
VLLGQLAGPGDVPVVVSVNLIDPGHRLVERAEGDEPFSERVEVRQAGVRCRPSARGKVRRA